MLQFTILAKRCFVSLVVVVCVHISDGDVINITCVHVCKLETLFLWCEERRIGNQYKTCREVYVNYDG